MQIHGRIYVVPRPSGFVHQHLAPYVGIDTKNYVGSLSFFSSNFTTVNLQNLQKPINRKDPNSNTCALPSLSVLVKATSKLQKNYIQKLLKKHLHFSLNLHTCPKAPGERLGEVAGFFRALQWLSTRTWRAAAAERCYHRRHSHADSGRS
ncbi:hypothetical protein ACFX2C_008561 [Malus domestica]